MKRWIARLILTIAVLWSWSATAQVRFVVYYTDLAALVAANVSGNADIQRVAVVKYTGVTGDIDTGGVFYYDPASVLAVNGVTVLKPTNANGRWIRNNAPGGSSGGVGTGTPSWINVTDPAYGANATDAVADDAAILAAKAVAYTISGATLYFPPGTYYVTNTATLTITNKVKLLGDSGVNYNSQAIGTKIVKRASVAGPLILFTNLTARGSSVEGLALQGEAGNTGDGIWAAAPMITIRDTTVEGMGNNGIRIGGNGTENCNVFHIQNVSANLNTGSGMAISSNPSGAPDANAGTVIGFFAINNGGDGLVITNGWNSGLYGLVLENNTGEGLRLKDGAENNIIDITDSENNTGASTAGVIEANAHDNTIRAPESVMKNIVDTNVESTTRLIGRFVVGNGTTNNVYFDGTGAQNYVVGKLRLGDTTAETLYQLTVKNDLRILATNNVGRLILENSAIQYWQLGLSGNDVTGQKFNIVNGTTGNDVLTIQTNSDNVAFVNKVVIGNTDPDNGGANHLRVVGNVLINSNLTVQGTISGSLNANELTSGTIPEARLASVAYSKLTAGQNDQLLTNGNQFLSASVKELQGYSQSTTYSWDLDGNRSQVLFLTNNTTVSFANVPTATNVAEFFSLTISNTGSHTLAFTEPANGQWIGGEPVISAGAEIFVNAFWTGYRLALWSSVDGMTLAHFNTNQFSTNNTTWPIAIKTDASVTNLTFPATQTASSGTNTLDDYEEGTWTPFDNSGAGLAFTGISGNCRYVKVGKLVTASFRFVYPATADTSGANVGGLPFTTATGTDGQGGFLSYNDSGLVLFLAAANNGTFFVFFKNDGVQPSNAALSGKDFRGTVIYQASQ